MKERLDHISNEKLQELLDEIDGSTEAQRVLATLAYIQGDSTSRLTERHNVSQQTIRNWLSRFEVRPLVKAPFDDERTGRPRKLSDEEQEHLVKELRDSPQKVGFEQQAWSLRLVSHHLHSEYGVEYSLHHIRRLMQEAGLSWRTARRHHHGGAPEQPAEFQETVNNGLELIENAWTIVAFDQFSKPVSNVLPRAQHRISSRPTAKVVPSTDRVTVPRAITHDGRRL